MAMKIAALLLLLGVLVLQNALWRGDGGLSKTRELSSVITQLQGSNAKLREDNQSLAAEILDLKDGLEAIEERARSDVGMLGPDEDFYRLIYPDDQH